MIDVETHDHKAISVCGDAKAVIIGTQIVVQKDDEVFFYSTSNKHQKLNENGGYIIAVSSV